MLILAVDTTTPVGSVALLDKTKLIAECNTDSPFTHSARLLRSIHFLLQTCRLEIKDAEGFAVAAGPGSFTGIRIGLSTVKSLAFASGKPVAAVSSLQALAWKLRDLHGRLICPLVDAKKGEIYAALFESRKEGLAELIPQGVYDPDRFFSLLPSHRIISFLGDGLSLHKSSLVAYLKDKARFPSRTLFLAHEVGLLGYEILRSKKGLTSAEVEPLYFRKSQAEEKR